MSDDNKETPIVDQQVSHPSGGGSNSKLKGLLIKIVGVSLLAIVFAWASSLFYFAYFRPPKDNYMRGYFIGWRTQSGIESMTVPYKFKKKVYDPNDFKKRVKKYMDVTQNNNLMNSGKDKKNYYHGLLDDYFPVHLPRKEINHHSFFNTVDDMKQHYAVRGMIRRYAKDKKFLNSRKALGDGVTDKDQLKPLFDENEERLLLEANDEKIAKIFGKTAFIQGADEFTKEQLKAFSIETIPKLEGNYFSKDFVAIIEIANVKDYYNNLYKFLNSLLNKKYKNFTLPKDFKYGNKDYKKVGEQVKAKNEELFDDISELVPGIYTNKANEFYDFRYRDSKDFDAMRDRNYNIYLMLADIGMGRPSTRSSFFFSSLAYSFYYATINVKLEEIKIPEKSKKKAPERDKRVQYAFDYIFQNAYSDTSIADYEKSQSWFTRKLLLPKYVLFSTLNKSKLLTEDQIKRDAKSLMKGFKDNLQIKN